MLQLGIFSKLFLDSVARFSGSSLSSGVHTIMRWWAGSYEDPLSMPGVGLTGSGITYLYTDRNASHLELHLHCPLNQVPTWSEWLERQCFPPIVLLTSSIINPLPQQHGSVHYIHQEHTSHILYDQLQSCAAKTEQYSNIRCFAIGQMSLLIIPCGSSTFAT